jgi:hypothetical protein
MTPGSAWGVEFAGRAKQTREHHPWIRDGQEERTDPDIAAPGFGRRCRRSVGHLLRVVGRWLDRPVGAVPRPGRAVEA